MRPSESTPTAINNVKSFLQFHWFIFLARKNPSACFLHVARADALHVYWFFFCQSVVFALFVVFLGSFLLHSSVHNSVCVGMSRITNTLFKLFKNSRTLEKIVTLPCYSFGWLVASVSGTLFKYTLIGRLFCFFSQMDAQRIA